MPGPNSSLNKNEVGNHEFMSFYPSLSNLNLHPRELNFAFHFFQNKNPEASQIVLRVPGDADESSS